MPSCPDVAYRYSKAPRQDAETTHSTAKYTSRVSAAIREVAGLFIRSVKRVMAVPLETG